jgi:hypothetical protein
MALTAVEKKYSRYRMRRKANPSVIDTIEGKLAIASRFGISEELPVALISAYNNQKDVAIESTVIYNDAVRAADEAYTTSVPFRSLAWTLRQEIYNEMAANNVVRPKNFGIFSAKNYNQFTGAQSSKRFLRKKLTFSIVDQLSKLKEFSERKGFVIDKASRDKIAQIIVLQQDWADIYNNAINVAIVNLKSRTDSVVELNETERLISAIVTPPVNARA